MGRKLYDLRLKRKSNPIAEFTAEADIEERDELRQLLADAIERDGWDESRIGEFELEIRETGNRSLIMTYVASHRP